MIACDNRPAIRQQMTASYGVEAVADWVPVLQNPAVTSVVIATPATSHVEIAIRCLDAGRHVLIEKPLSLDLSGIDQLLAARDRAQRFTAIAYVPGYYRGVETAIRMTRNISRKPTGSSDTGRSER